MVLSRFDTDDRLVENELDVVLEGCSSAVGGGSDTDCASSA